MDLKENVYTLKGCNSFWQASEEGSTLKGKSLLPLGANSFLLEKIQFQKGLCVQESKQEITKVVSLLKYGGKSTKCIKPSSDKGYVNSEMFFFYPSEHYDTYFGGLRIKVSSWVTIGHKFLKVIFIERHEILHSRRAVVSLWQKNVHSTG